MPRLTHRVSTLDELGDPDAPIGSREWAIYFLRQAKSARKDLDSDAQRLRSLLSKLEGGNASAALGVLSFGRLCSTELDLDPKQVEAIKKAKKGDTLQAALGTHGGDRRSGEFQGSRNTLNGRGSVYIMARLERDGFDELVEMVRSGELTAKEAGRRAGIVRPPDPVEVAFKAYKKLNPDQREEFHELVRGTP